MAPRRVVLVDPSEAGNAVADRLRMQGYAVTITQDACEGAHLALSDPPAAIVADLWMPGISGVQLSRLLRSEPATQHVPIILRGPQQGQRHRFWAERAGASAYVSRDHIGELVRGIAAAIEAAPPPSNFFMQLTGDSVLIRDRIAAHLDSALFDSVIAAEVRALGTCESFARLFDLLSQFVARLTSYRWMAVHTDHPAQMGLHTHPRNRVAAEEEARRVLAVPGASLLALVEDHDASEDSAGPSPISEPIKIGNEVLGRIALAGSHQADAKDEELVRTIARELGGPIRIAGLVEESQRLAMFDSLTGLMNRRAFSGAGAGEVARCRRYGFPVSTMLLDIDHFKAINDRFGHATGDAVLVAMGQTLSKQIRAGDLVGRLGGEEFVIVLSGADRAGALLSAERIRGAIEALEIKDSSQQRINVTVSIGLAQLEPEDDLGRAIDRADHAMYAAKAAGRNRVVAASRVSKEPEAANAPERAAS